MTRPPFGLSLDEALSLLRCTLTQWVNLPTLSPGQETTLQEGAQRLRSGEPLAYIVGEVAFHGLALTVSPAVLIPRPETEEWLLQWLTATPLPPHGRVLDVGTGSGAIALAVAQNHPGALIAASDLSMDALRTAQHNATRHHLSVHFLQGDLLYPFGDELFHWVLGNPPYIGEREKAALDPSLEHEPHTALFSGTEGLDHLRVLLADVHKVLTPGGHYCFEIGHQQADAVAALPHPGVTLSIGTDDAGRFRTIHGQRTVHD